MASLHDDAHVSVQRIRGALVASAQGDLGSDLLVRLRGALYAHVAGAPVRHVILDLSGVSILGGAEFDALKRLVRVLSALGPEVIVCGLGPGVAAALAELDVDLGRLAPAQRLDDALLRAEAPRPRPAPRSPRAARRGAR